MKSRGTRRRWHPVPLARESWELKAALAVLLPALAFVLCESFRSLLGSAFEQPFIAAVALAAWFGGIYCGLAATAVSTLTVAYFFIPPVQSFRVAGVTGWTQLITLGGTCVLITVLIHTIYRAQVATDDAEARHRSASELIPFGVWRADSQGNMVELGESFLSAFATSMTRCAGLGWTDLIVPDEREPVIAEWKKCMESGDFWDCEYHMVAKGGAVFSVLSRGVPVFSSSGKKSWIGIQLDVTEREKMTEQRVEQERDLTRFNSELDQFGYVASHDLQEPLRMIASYLQLLSRRYQGKLDAEAQEFIGYSVEGANRLQALLQGLQLLSVVGKFPERRTDVSLADAVQRARNNRAVTLNQTGSTVEFGNLPTVRCDGFEITQLFENVFDNSIKFRSPGQPAHIKVFATQEKRFWNIAIQDDGIGMEPEYLQRIFDLFQRLHPRSEYPGTGIGLTICKKIVEVHGGRIWAESQPGSGTTIHFTLPAA